jgi:hypothetical protein
VFQSFSGNELLFKDYWIKHYQTLGLDFPDEPLNGAIWGLWSLFLVLGILQLSKKFNFIETALTAWFLAFVMMWVAIGNLNVLPTSLLVFAIPLSLLECVVATWIIKSLYKINIEK